MSASLDPERWRRIRDLLDVLLALPADARESALRARCGDDEALADEVRGFLEAHDRAGSFIERPAGGGLGALHPPRLERYRILGELGVGGMSVVYLAARDDDAYRKTVAIKVLREGLGSPELVARFRAERQILAELEHPGIARLLDGGTTEDGRPFLVMEYVIGEPIDAYCNRHRLDIEARVRLMLEVCGAIQFAHRNLIVHRDLKPGNILVTPDGKPMVLDFGIAKLLAQGPDRPTLAATRTDALGPMTPAYASPEQARGEALTTSSDVYSLGVVLYELLTGRRPHSIDGDNPLRTLERIAQTVPEPPSRVVARSPDLDAAGTAGMSAAEVAARRGTDVATLARRLRGDLDMILLEALRKEPERRYATAQALADDLDRHLRGHPVAARPDTLGYRVASFTRRHTAAVAASLALVSVLVAALVVLLVQRRAVLDERDEARRVSSFLTELFTLPDPSRSRGETITARELLDRGARSIADELSARPGTQGALMLTMGRSYKGLGLLREADALLGEAEARLADAHGRRHADVAAAVHERADVALAAGRYPEAVALFEDALARRRAALGERHPAVAETRFRLGRALTDTGAWDRAETELAAAHDIAHGLGDDALQAEVLERWASVAAERGRLDEAEARYRRALATLRRIHGERHPAVVLALNDLADLERRRERWADAEGRLEAARALGASIFEGDHPHLALTVGNLALVRLQAGDLEGAADAFDEALRLHRSVFAADHPRRAIVLHNLALLYRARGDVSGALELVKRSLAVLEDGLGPEHPETANAANSLAELHLGMGRLDDAEPLLRRAARVLERTHPGGHPRLANVLANLGDLAQQRGRLDDAAGRYAQAIDMLRAGPEGGHHRLANLISNAGTVQQALGQADAAVALYEEALELLADVGGPDALFAGTATRLARLEIEHRRWSRAAGMARLALERFPDAMPWRLQWLAMATSALARAQLELGDAETAARTLAPVLAEARAELGDADATTRSLEATLARARRAGAPP